ncbi:fibroblast growth factor-binding protein 3 [Ochotona curzoniae]|uniref:fibroblast growth factor-binding protein 3 n=1 Tax=Ochotona curzoniae TaxID=130825 RepID=UPI001B34F991|nr:fibroblast growth factor-binding protein 3 [Ochotona curzoniae]
MTPPGLQAPLSLLLLFLLGGSLVAAARRDKGAAGGPAGGSSGRFVGPEQHACTWQLRRPAPGASAGSELTLRCQSPDGALLECAYRGEPERCAAYAARGAHYWKQVLGALRKKRQPCQDPAPLRARLCAGRKGNGAELHLVPRGASPPVGPTAAGGSEVPRPRPRNRGRPRDSAHVPTAGLPPTSAPSPEKLPERKSKKKATSEPNSERPLGSGPNPDGLLANSELTETYCAEKWHSLCNFFVNFWNG